MEVQKVPKEHLAVIRRLKTFAVGVTNISQKKGNALHKRVTNEGVVELARRVDVYKGKNLQALSSWW